MLRTEINRRNAERWRSVPDYVDYLICNFAESLPLAACIDIDSTILDEMDHKIMPDCLDAFQYLKSNGVEVFIVTARSQSIRLETIDELSCEGIKPFLYKELLMNKEPRNGVDHSELKLAHRRYIRENYALVLAIGDKIHDLIGYTESDAAYYNILMETLKQY